VFHKKKIKRKRANRERGEKEIGEDRGRRMEKSPKRFDTGKENT